MTTEIARCANNDCVAIFLRRLPRRRFDSFCPACLKEIRDEARLLTDDQIDDEEFEGDTDGASNA